jgi:hypothetical protein
MTYLVCDNCGYIHCPDERPCRKCGVGRYWEFRELDRALKRSQLIQDRVASEAKASVAEGRA